ncbi:MAG: hypothetical protein M3456_14670 [Actinomycetota bacterium]|nr:hypothetical protein [Actinomycetota bacterium]
MADPPRYPDSDDTGVGPTADRPPATPCWVKVFGIIALVVVLILVVNQFTGFPGGGHSPDVHATSGDVGGQAPPSNVTLSSVIEDHAPPEGGRG